MFYEKKAKSSKEKNNRFAIKFLIIFVLGYTFFFTSNIFMDYEIEKDIVINKIGDVKFSNNIEYTLAYVAMSEDEDEMQIILEKDDSLYSGKSQYKFYSHANGRRHLEDMKKKEKAEFVILNAKGLSKKLHQFQVRIKMESDLITFNVDKNNMKYVKSFKDEDEVQLRKKVIDLKISSYKNEIEAKKKEIDRCEQDILDNMKKISKLNKELNYKVEDEKEKLMEKISTLKNNIAISQEDIISKKDEIKILKLKIQKQKEKEKTLN